MTNELKPCPFCGGEAFIYDRPHPYVECSDCVASTAFHETTEQAMNTRVERTCKPNVFMDEQITESIQRWLGECECGAILGEGTDEYAVSLCFPHYCPCCGAKVVE